MELSLRKATIDDSQALGTISAKGWKTAYRGILSDDYLDAITVETKIDQWVTLFNADNINCSVFVGTVDGKVVGFCNIGLNRDDDVVDKRTVGELWGIYVDPDQWDKGFGGILMAKGIQELIKMGFKKATLWTLIKNAKSRKFYENRGWKPDGKVKSVDSRGTMLEEIRYVIDL